ncbi:ribosomal protein L14, putative [Trichomonas vaginalis G3]|uniref:Ribosomal protein L14, putative n=1 Tax=Trichomonas vaginalis (strain ATCC PRA-98 / G3) TaxID=412133 RepID=A2FDG4_TRIV3|nr:ribosomal large subunit biogenesis [Trichomonas vaginalis G3]EAX97041.1 ribosomal protein L14, putative [Trichomonas vaginalis G3]KAI5515682.1 ribosomal large subunit biogenesis [Trichomonas vaginalis G3]|eukprot:XP_001309971.1 ribosomal protein L14 [Trichomonas vaginalis G3]
MPFKQFVEIGRVALINFGELVDKLAIIVDIVDDKRVLIDVLEFDAPRQTIPIQRLKLTDYVAKIQRNAAPEAAKAAAKDLVKQFYESAWGKQVIARKNKAQMNDFQRFKYAQLEAKRDALVAKELNNH